MLQNLRKHAQGWIAGIIVALIAISFIFFGIENYLQGGVDATTVATVNDKPISVNELSVVYERLRRQQNNPATSADQAAQTALKKQALQQLIEANVLADAASKAGLFVSQPFLRSVITHLPLFQVNGKFSPERFQQALVASSLSEAAFLEDFKRNLLIYEMRVGLTNSVIVLPNEIEQALKLNGQKRDFGYFLISPERFMTEIVVDETAINHYYQQNIEKFKSPEKISLEYIVLDAGALKKQLQVTEQEIEQNYNADAAVKTAKVKPLAEVKEQIRQNLLQQKLEQLFIAQNDKLANLAYTNPDSLAPVAAALNLTVQTTDLFSRQEKLTGLLANPKIMAAAYSENVLQQNNNSDPIEVSEGKVVVLRIKEHKLSQPRPLAEVSAQIKQQLQKDLAVQKAKAQAQAVIAELKKGVAPEKVAQQFQLVWQPKTNVGRDAKDINPKILQVVFDTTVAQEKINTPTAVIELPAGGVAVAAITRVIPGVAEKATTQERNLVKSELEAIEAQALYDLYVKEQMSKANIKIIANSGS